MHNDPIIYLLIQFFSCRKKKKSFLRAEQHQFCGYLESINLPLKVPFLNFKVQLIFWKVHSLLLYLVSPTYYSLLEVLPRNRRFFSDFRGTLQFSSWSCIKFFLRPCLEHCCPIWNISPSFRTLLQHRGGQSVSLILPYVQLRSWVIIDSWAPGKK